MPQQISIVFAGTPAFALPTLKALIDDSAFRVDLVITQPDKPAGRKQEMTPPPVKVLAGKHGIAVWQPSDINKKWGQLPTKNRPDFLVVVAYGQILKQEILSFPKNAPLNVHASLLPRWRGASPMQHSILAGDTETGITIQRMALELDTGPILAQKKRMIDERETFRSLHDDLSEMAAALLPQTLKTPLRETPQDDTKATLCKKLTRAMGEVDPKTMTAEEIDRRVRALVPWPGVVCPMAGASVKLLETALSEVKGSVGLPCKDSTLWVLKLQPPGKNVMDAAAWMRGKK